jgi:ureidoacrylate peracid hydrolase
MRMPQLGLIRLDATALLVVDMQNAFCHRAGGFAQAGRDVSAQNAIVPTVARLVRAARGSGLCVIWTIQEGLGPNERARLGRRIPALLGRQGAGIPETWSIRSTWDAELIDELRAEIHPDDHVVRKHRMSSFYSTTLDSILRIRQIDCLIVAGVNTEKCIESTVRDASFRDLDVLVVEDAVATSDHDFHVDSLRKIDRYFGAVVSSDVIVRELTDADQGAEAYSPAPVVTGG